MFLFSQFPQEAEFEKVELTISGAYEAPYFIHGKHKNSDWTSTIRDNPAPWGEVEIPNVLTLTFPSFAMKKVDDMEELTNFYEKMMKHFADLSGTGKMIRHERLVYDIQLSMGEQKMYLSLLSVNICLNNCTY